MKDYIISVKNLNLKYMFVRNMNMKQEFIKLFSRENREKKTKEVWALKNLSFNIERGTTVGLIGTNGSGKTTLLKTIANIFKPDSGEISIKSEAVSLLTLGAGFQPELAGIENIYLNGLLLGFNKKEIDKRLSEIIEFSELGEFINYPVRTYSSGMKTRLAFSVASHIEPDILLIDEVLGVGDETFKVKSQERIKKLIGEDRTVLIVSHNLQAVKDMCTHTMWLHKGELVEFGETEEVIENYLSFIKKNRTNEMEG